MQKIRRFTLWCLAVFGMLALTGCTARELEDRTFPQAMEVTLVSGERTGEQSLGEDKKLLMGGFGEYMVQGDSLEELCRAYQNKSDKYLDLGHIKVIIFGEALLAEEEQMRKLLQEFGNSPVFARNILVFSYPFEDGESCLNKMEEKGIIPGEYLSDLYRNNPEKMNDTTCTLGQLLAE